MPSIRETPNIYDQPEPRCTADHFLVRSIRNGALSPIPQGPFNCLNEAREAADRMAATQSPRACVYELDWRQNVESFTEDGIYIECVRVLNMRQRIFA